MKNKGLLNVYNYEIPDLLVFYKIYFDAYFLIDNRETLCYNKIEEKRFVFIQCEEGSFL